MSETAVHKQAQYSFLKEEGRLLLRINGDWHITGKVPNWAPPAAPESSAVLELDFKELGYWDSSLIVFLETVRRWCTKTKRSFPEDKVPEKLRPLLEQLQKAESTSIPKHGDSLFTLLGKETLHLGVQVQEINHFVGDCLLSSLRILRQPSRFRWRDFIAEMQQCGVMALPIISLVSFLIGITLAYTGAIILRLFGGDIWVADLVGLSITREMAAVMTAVVLAGRTGAAYAAQIGNMKANEEIDALSTLGVSAMDFLVAPRLLALAIMTPLLALYANMLGILGGMVIAMFLLSIPPTAYWVEMLTIVDMSDIMTGLIKASAFGLIVGTSGCLRGLQAERSADGVGKAATSAVVTAILLMVVADALFAVLFNFLGW